MEFILAAKYRVTQEIGRGGMGAVYDAVHTKTGRRVAVKLIQDSERSEESRVRFEREARAAGAIDSRHVAQVLDSGEDETGRPYIVMEYLHGEDLRSLLARLGPLDAPVALAIVAQALLGLHKAHEADVIHRDLKPGNVFIARTDDDECVVKVLDFGIAKVADLGIDERSSDGVIALEKLAADSRGCHVLTKTSAVVGSPPYMSPEQLGTPRDVDARTDLWSMGVVLYEALSGKTPTSHVVDLGARLASIRRDPPRDIREINASIPHELAAVVHRALEIDRAQRYASAREMLEAVRALAPAGTKVPAELLRRTDDSVPPSAYVTTRRQSLGAPGGDDGGGETRRERLSAPRSAPSSLEPSIDTTMSEATTSVMPGPRPPTRIWRSVALAGVAVAIAIGASAFAVESTWSGAPAATPLDPAPSASAEPDALAPDAVVAP
ncbi:MAG: serine/threonine protein kinase [Labilithrix sp.]|nr:serine/threonine protein kinase [Labilithrix sp.]